ncbi:hypothetical protein NIES4071_69390 [Calothrix sp. NIES-4071]|nr:hypothetical protein NIES4071_69390 [Calothrix sp. NIES-4071]BAZ61216.1 hypothetical protein NIES4105_69340 [Calothrix sp. NIES-4105]
MKYLVYLFSLVFLMLPLSANAQIQPDASLGTHVNNNVNINGALKDIINGGTIRGNNLFHSFSEFNINKVQQVYFANPIDITNIFARVTGVNPSYINGTLGVAYNANLFLINPNGVLFGEFASLNLKGSFIGTTADKVLFADNTEFSSRNPLTTQLLSVSVPIGLGFGTNSGTINVSGAGHNLIAKDAVLSPYTSTGSNSQLKVEAGQTLALIGAGVNINGGVLKAPGGRIDIGSVAGSQEVVKIDSTAQGLTFDYNNVSNFGNINFTQKSLVSTSGINAGSIQVSGKQVSLNDGSTLWIQNQGTQGAGAIQVNATDQIEVNGAVPNSNIRSYILAETVAPGSSSNIKISTPRLIVQDGGAVSSRTFSKGAAGSVDVNTTESVKISGYSSTNPRINSGITSFTFSNSNAQDVNISTKQLSVLDGAILASATFNQGTSGSVTVNADTIEVSGTTPDFASNSAIAASSYGSGNVGSVIINTRGLSVRDSGLVSTTSFGNGSAGVVKINSSEYIDVTGSKKGSRFPSLIVSAIDSQSESLRLLLNLPKVPMGNSGDININTRRLNVTDGAILGVYNSGIGNAGKLTINSNSVLLNNQGGIIATTFSGRGGNISVQANNIQLNRNSSITSTAMGLGNGGNIDLKADTIVGLNDSDITANAFQGKGGNININTQGIFSSFDSNITASSQLGINGEIKITTPQLNQQNNLQQQPTNFISTDVDVVASSCLAQRNATSGKFIVTGNGGLAVTPENDFDLPLSVVTVAPIITTSSNNNIKAQPSANHSKLQTWKIGNPIQQADQLVKTQDGRLLLVQSKLEQDIKSITCNG